MLKAITATNYLGESLRLDLARPEYSGFVVKSVTGLGPGKANINTSDISTTDGGLFNSARLPVRNIVLSLEFMEVFSRLDQWSQTIEEARLMSYKIFPIKRPVTLIFETDKRTVEISGYVESNEPTIFSKNEGSEISIICPDPYFYSIDNINSTEGYSVEPVFEFPFSNESTTESLLEMGTISGDAEQSIEYDGDIEIGVIITIRATGEVNNLKIIHTSRNASGSIQINTDKLKKVMGTDYAIKEGDKIVISTMQGNKTVKLIRDGIEYLILNCLDRNTDWFRLVRGKNTFTYIADFDGEHNLNVTIESRTRYEGV
jgi:hypothetical protein